MVKCEMLKAHLREVELEESKHCRYFSGHSQSGARNDGLVSPTNLTDGLYSSSPATRRSKSVKLAEMESPLCSRPAFPVGEFSSYSLQHPFIDLDYVGMEKEPDADFEMECSNGPVDSFSSDHFRMFDFKVKKCARGSSHDWTQCPYAHPGEKARRRDLRKYHYSGTTCPEFRKGNCTRGDLCEFAHGVFETWLHPARYRTQPCKDGTSCRRLVCFFAHTPQQLRVLPEQNSRSSTDGLPAIEASFASSFPFLASPISVSPLATPIVSPPLSPMSRSLGSTPMKEMRSSLRSLQLYKVKSLPSTRKVQVESPVFGSPTRNGNFSLPTTPTRIRTFSGIRRLDSWEEHCEEEPVMERVESGKDLRAKMYEKLKKENSLDRIDPSPSFDPELYRVTKSIIS